MDELLKRIVNYFRNDYTGDDKTAPAFALSPQELRLIYNLYSENCRLKSELNKLKASKK